MFENENDSIDLSDIKFLEISKNNRIKNNRLIDIDFVFSRIRNLNNNHFDEKEFTTSCSTSDDLLLSISKINLIPEIKCESFADQNRSISEVLISHSHSPCTADIIESVIANNIDGIETEHFHNKPKEYNHEEKLIRVFQHGTTNRVISSFHYDDVANFDLQKARKCNTTFQVSKLNSLEVVHSKNPPNVDIEEYQCNKLREFTYFRNKVMSASFMK